MPGRIPAQERCDISANSCNKQYDSPEILVMCMIIGTEHFLDQFTLDVTLYSQFTSSPRSAGLFRTGLKGRQGRPSAYRAPGLKGSLRKMCKSKIICYTNS